MLLTTTLLLLVASLAQSSSIDDYHNEKHVLFAFTGGDYSNYETWRWDKITHLGFWTEPSENVRYLAEQHGVKLLEDAHLPDKSTWTDADARKKFAQEKADLVKSKNLHGVFFDYEGNGLSKDQKQAYTLLAKEVKDAVNGTVVVCVGGRPTYEWRDYDYTGLASASDFLFVMGYDLIAWDDYTCITKGTCSPADAPIKDLELGLNEYLKDVPSSNLVLGLPWYGNRYTDVLVPFNDGQIDYKDVLAVYDNNKVKETRFDSDSQTYVIKCHGACVDGKKGSTIWFDNEVTLRTKYKLAKKYNLLGVGMWAVDKLPGPNDDGSDPHKENRTAMWDAIVSWNNNSSSNPLLKSFEATSYLTSNTFPSKDHPARLLNSTIQFNSTEGKSDLVTLRFDATKTMQTVLGFGGAITDSVAHVFNEMSEDRQKEAVEALFGESGQQYNLVRMTIGSTDFSTTVYNYNPNKDNFNQSLFSIDHDKKQIIPLAKRALGANSKLEILSSPWSPPGWMKVGWLTFKGYMRNSAKPGMIQKDDIFESYALYTSKYISAMKEEGLKVSRITIQNEPDSADHMVVATYPACNFNGTDEGHYLKNYLGPRIRKDHPEVQIYIHDGQKFHDVPIKSRVDDILSAVGGLESGFVDGVAFHWYGDNLKNFQYLGELRDAYPKLSLLATEATLQDPRTQTDPWGEAMKYAIDIIGDLQNGAEGWIEWNVLLESNGGPTCIGPTETTLCTPEIGHCDAPLLYKKSSDEIEYRGTYHYMAHFSRFMSRGDLIVNATTTSDNTPLRSVASISPDGSKMNIVVLNTDSKSTVEYNLDVGLGSVASSISLPPRSIQTIVVDMK